MTRSELIEAMARAAIEADSGPAGSTLFDIHLAEFGDGYRSSMEAALSAIERAGWSLMPAEPNARITAATFVQTEDPTADDRAVAMNAITLLPSSPVEKVVEALSDLVRDYRSMISAGTLK